MVCEVRESHTKEKMGWDFLRQLKEIVWQLHRESRLTNLIFRNIDELKALD